MSESLPSPDKHRGSGLDPNGGQYPNFRWVRVNNVDELEKFYREIVDPLKRAAQELGYALAVHGSMRRDLDAIAVPWAEDHADKDDLARALHNAACGLWQAKYQWEAKPCGRSAASFPICWVDRAEFPNETNLGHIDLSVMPASTVSHVAQNDIASENAFVNGARFGWNCGITEDREKFDQAIERRNAEILAASAPSTTPQKPRGAYVPLTEEEIEDMRPGAAWKDGEVAQGYTSVSKMRVLCDMAINCLLYAQEIHRLRDTPVSATPCIPVTEIEAEIEHIKQNAEGLRRFTGQENEARCRELCAMYLREFIQAWQFGQQIAVLNRADGGKATDVR